MLADVVRVPNTYFSFQFDGTQGSIDDLITKCDSTDRPTINYVNATTWQVGNPGAGTGNKGLSDVVVFERTPLEVVRMVDDYPNTTNYNLLWDEI